MAVIRASIPAVLEALLHVRGPDVVCEFEMGDGRYVYSLRAALLRLETCLPFHIAQGVEPEPCLSVVVRPVNYDTEVALNVAWLRQVSCEGPPGWAEALP